MAGVIRTLARSGNFHCIDQLPGAFGLAVLDRELLLIEPANVAADGDQPFADLDGQLAQSLMMALSERGHNSHLQTPVGIAQVGFANRGIEQHGVSERRDHNRVHPYRNSSKY